MVRRVDSREDLSQRSTAAAAVVSTAAAAPRLTHFANNENSTLLADSNKITLNFYENNNNTNANNHSTANLNARDEDDGEKYVDFYGEQEADQEDQVLIGDDNNNEVDEEYDGQLHHLWI